MVQIKKWVLRFLPGEIIGTLTAVSTASIAHVFTDNGILVAYSGSLGEAIGFYTTIIIQTIFVYKKKYFVQVDSLKIGDFAKIIRNLLIEFGPAGIIDGLLLRPFFMYVFPMILKDFTLGLLIGKIMGDITFYVLVIITTKIKESFIKQT